MKRNIFIFVLLLLTVFSFSQSKEILVNININRNNKFYNVINENVDCIKLGYIKGNVSFESYGKNYFSIDKINYYAYKNGVKYFLGFVDKDGIYDKSLKLIKKSPFVPTKTLVSIGLSSFMLENPFGASLILKDLDNDELSNTDSFAYLNIDFIEHSLFVYEPEYY